MPKKRFDLIGIGPLFEDLIITMRSRYTHEVKYERGVIKHLCLEAGFKEKATQFSRSTGGSAANILCMLTKLDDYSLGCFAKLGSDVISDWLIRDLKNFGVHADKILREQGEVGASIIVTNPEIRDRSIISYRGIGDQLSPEDIREKSEYLVDAEWHNISSFTRNISIKAVMDLVELEKKNGIKLFFTPSISMISAFKKETLKVVQNSHVLSLNDVEAMELSNIDNVQDAAVFLKGLGPRLVFVTRGRNGIIAIDDKNRYGIDSYPVETMNTVGAGDVCAAVFWDGIYNELEIEDILRRASAASAIKIQTSGAKKGLPDNEKISRFLKEKGKRNMKIFKKP